MQAFSHVTTILVFVLLSYSLVNRGLEFLLSQEQPHKQIKFQLTQKLINTIVRLSLYSMVAFTISLGVDPVTRQAEQGLIRGLLDFIVIVLIWFSPYEIQKIKRTDISRLPISICWIVSVLYGSVGLSLLASPELWVNYLLFIEIFWSTSVTALKMMLFLHVVLTQINPWYQSLPRA